MTRGGFTQSETGGTKGNKKGLIVCAVFALDSAHARRRIHTLEVFGGREGERLGLGGLKALRNVH